MHLKAVSIQNGSQSKVDAVPAAVLAFLRTSLGGSFLGGFSMIVEQYPFFIEHQAKIERQIPVVALER